jgi:hypothetical protein
MNIQVSLKFPETEYWQWIEVYENTAIPQYNEDGISRHFHNIDQDNLIKFIMIHKSGKQFIIPKVEDDNWRLIHFFNRGKTLSTSGKEQGEFKYPVAGYQITRNDTNFKCLNAFLQNGDVQIIYR